MALSKSERRILKAIATTVFPHGGAIDTGALDAHVVDYVEDYLGRLPFWDQLQLRAFFRLFDLGFAVTTNAPGRRFVDAHPDERRTYMDSWEHSSSYQKRLGWQGIRMVFTFAYAESPAVKAAIGQIEVPPTTDVQTELKALAQLSRKLN